MNIKLNLGKSCLKVIIRTYGIKEIFIPYYSCKAIWKAIREENCKIKFYHIDKNFMPSCNFESDAFILYINYFGLFEKNCKILAKKYKNLITDNTQGFYSQHYGIASFNSLRKFFPVQNGAYLKIEKELVLNFGRDDLKLDYARIEENYDLFKYNEIKLNGEKIKIISPDVEHFMQKIDYEKDKLTRIKKFNKYTEILNDYNLIKLPKIKNNVPYCYPLCTYNKKIIKKLEKFTILRLWNDLPENFAESKFLSNVASLPVDNCKYSEKIIKELLL